MKSAGRSLLPFAQPAADMTVQKMKPRAKALLMSIYRNDLPQLGGDLFLTDGGLETTLIFQDGVDLPNFAAFTLLDTRERRRRLSAYYRKHATIAKDAGAGFLTDTPTWRANPDWGAKLGMAPEAVDAVNRDAAAFLVALRTHMAPDGADDKFRFVISGCVGPRGDGYDPGDLMTTRQAQDYHARQIRVFASTGIDMIGAMTITNTEEAAGIARAAREADMPCAISFTLETDGRLPTGQALADAIVQVDAESGGWPAYYMINCAHPEHFVSTLDQPMPALRRLQGIRANASRMSHAELDVCETLDDGNPSELGGQLAAFNRRYPWINILGGCCGTDHRHIGAISMAIAA